jgi:peptide/nickel transport system ATP-binding protein
MTDKMRKEPLIEVRKMKKYFPLKKKHIFQREVYSVKANEDISLTIYRGETFGLVGESGCGKSTLGRVILQLYPPTSGSALYYGIPLRKLNPKYVIKGIKSLPRIQARAKRFFDKSLVYDKKVEELEAFINSEEHKALKKVSEESIRALHEQIEATKKVREENVKATIGALERDRTKFKEANPDLEVIGKGIRWEEEVDKVRKFLEEYDGKVAIENYITLLHIPHGDTMNAYKKVIENTKLISKLESELKKFTLTKYEKQLANYKFKSKEAKKEASRTLRRGSEIAGEFILEPNIKEISELMLKEEMAHRNKFKREQEIENLELKIEMGNKRIARLEEDLKDLASDEKVAQVKENIANIKANINKHKDRIATLQKEVEDYKAEQDQYLAELEKFHFKDPQPITERCLDPEYQKKLEGNREYAINLEKVSKEEMRKLRQKLQIIFQDPYSSLDPRMTVGQAISEAVVEHGLFKKNSPELEEYIIDTMAKCGLDHYMIHRYPHQFSGGQRQRIVIARALALKPEFIVCDESVSALDVSIQSQILNLLEELKEKHSLTYLFISHDLSVIKHVSDRIGVMYLGNIVELTDSETLYDNPLHPYSKALISAIPTTTKKTRDRIILEGDIPSNIFPPSGCKFRTRCPIARDLCAKEVPELREVEPGHFVACHFYEETKNI